MFRVIALVFVVAIAVGPVRSEGQTPSPLARVRDLYSNAAYEDVLSAVAADATDAPEIGQYRVFSLIALGRPAEAEKAVEAMLTTHPGFHPTEASPRLLELFTSVRRRIAPDLLKSMYQSGKSALDRKDRAASVRAFTELLAIAADPDLKDDTKVTELAFLAGEFLELSRALPVPAPPPAEPAEPKAATPVSGTSTPGPSAPALPTVPAVPIREVLPRWFPPTTLRHAEYRGKILIHIGADGRVVSAEIVTPIHPLYDEGLLKASESWTYQPARSNGKAVPFDRLVEVTLKPPSNEVP